MTQNRLTKSKLMSYAYNNVYDIINNRTYVKDPKYPNSTTVNRKLVYRNDPFSKGNDYDSYPYIVVRFPKLAYDNTSTDGKHKNIGFEFSITVRTAMTGAVNDTGESTGVTNMQDIQDDLNETFNSETVKQLLRDLDMYKFMLTTDDNDEFIDSNNKHIFESTLTLVCETRMKVSN